MKKPLDIKAESVLGCCALILQLNSKPVVFSRDNIDASLPLKVILSKISREQHVKFVSHKMSVKKLNPDKLPLAYQTRQGAFVLLAKMSGEQVLIQQPSHDTPEVISLTELESQWQGHVIELKGCTGRFDITWFIPAFLKHRRLLGEVLLLSSILQLLALISPLFFQVIMDKVLVHHALSTLDVLVWALVIVGIFEVILKGLREYVFSHTANRIDVVLGGKLFSHVMGLPLAWFKHRQVGNIISRIQELDTIREFLTGSLLTLCIDIIFTVIFLAVMAKMSLSLTAVVLATLPCYVLLAWKSQMPLQKSIEQQFMTSAMNTSFLNESVSAAETIKCLAIEPRMQRRWEQQTAEMVEAGVYTQTLNTLVGQAVMLLQKITGVVIIWYGAHQVISLQLTIGQLIAFNMLLTQVHQPFSRFIELWQKFIQTRIAISKLGDMLNQPAEQAMDKFLPSTTLQGDITLSQVGFRYRPDLPPVLKDISLHIHGGECIGIVGPSGSGKSTLAKLLQKLYVPDSGQIKFDNYPIASLNTEYLRTQIGVVLQENYLFSLSVRQNIAIQNPSASLEQVVEAARTAGAHEFILQLPLGYDTVLAEAGRSLSGGQRQRIAIARALITCPRILIFDEATSALDDESQAIIQANMSEISRGRTVIMIAHRLSTVRHCDRIIALENGRITEAGTHQQLIERQGCYSRLWQLQQNLNRETA
ncbi:type I secretion system permease/ATPase [Enterobacter sp. A103]|uniref:type I secretion system permease/ATPase n=1 Tax=Enterobacter sp. A103 TaxID=3102785 RepID=UPI002ACA0284|nr:type I secretion system permease/ATPase [Enterobacter sp. A103]MDZ5641683.1 type I secretion system permease/ATPase [Enterobacter sp. A103]